MEEKEMFVGVSVIETDKLLALAEEKGNLIAKICDLEHQLNDKKFEMVELKDKLDSLDTKLWSANHRIKELEDAIIKLKGEESNG